LVLENGLQTDARYALVRLDGNGQVTEAHMVRGTSLRLGDFSLSSEGDLTGELVDLVGDLTGTRTESALIVRPERMPSDPQRLVGRPIGVTVPNDHRPDSVETYTIEKVTVLEGGLLRLDLAGYPQFGKGWHNVAEIDPE